MLFVTYPAKGLKAKLLLEASIISLYSSSFQDNRLRIGDGKAAAELKAALVLRYDVEIRVRIAVAERTEVDLGAAHSFLMAPGSSQICNVSLRSCLVALAQLLLMALERQCAAALVMP